MPENRLKSGVPAVCVYPQRCQPTLFFVYDLIQKELSPSEAALFALAENSFETGCVMRKEDNHAFMCGSETSGALTRETPFA